MNNLNTIQFSISDRVATISLNRPDAANGLNLELVTELAQVAKEVAQDDDIKAVIITAEGRFFCAGGDVKSMYEAKENPGAAVRKIADKLHEAIVIFARMQAPVICAVNGTAAGAGFSLAVCADLVVASKDAKFTMAYSNIGLSPDGSSSYFLPRLVGLRKAQELMFTNKLLTAQEALDWGLINAITESDQVLAQANDWAKMFVKGSKASNFAIKKLLIASGFNSLETQLDLESDTIEECANGVDGREGVRSFIEKEKPSFQ